MQWLIDLIIESIGVPPVFIDRGDYVLNDFENGDFTIDGNWHELDLSGIIPEGTSAVVIRCGFHCDFVSWMFKVRKAGTTSLLRTSVGIQNVAGVKNSPNPTIGVSSSRKIEYNFEPAANLAVGILVRGWFL